MQKPILLGLFISCALLQGADETAPTINDDLWLTLPCSSQEQEISINLSQINPITQNSFAQDIKASFAQERAYELVYYACFGKNREVEYRALDSDNFTKWITEQPTDPASRLPIISPIAYVEIEPNGPFGNFHVTSLDPKMLLDDLEIAKRKMKASMELRKPFIDQYKAGLKRKRAEESDDFRIIKTMSSIAGAAAVHAAKRYLPIQK